MQTAASRMHEKSIRLFDIGIKPRKCDTNGFKQTALLVLNLLSSLLTGQTRTPYQADRRALPDETAR